MESSTKAPAHTSSESGARGQLLAEAAKAVVRIHKEYYGKGPVKARAHLSKDLLTVVLEGGYTRGEQTLRERGQAQEVVRSRLAMQRSIETEFRAAIESLLYRSVRSVMSANDPERDLQVEVFVLHPRGSEALDDEEEDQIAEHVPAEADGDLTERAHHAQERHRELLEEHRALRSEQAQSRRALSEHHRSG